MKKVFFLLSLLVFSVVAFSQITFLDPGKSIPTDAREGLLVSSYSFGSAGSSPAITLTLEASSAFPDLYQATAEGTIFKKMELTTFELGKVSSEITFTNVIIGAFQLSPDGSAVITLIYTSMRAK